MRRILVLTLLLVVTSVVALQLQGHGGYILLQLGEWSIETSLSFALLTMFALFSLLLLLIRLLSGFIHAPRNLRLWRRAQRTRRARKELTMGMITLAEGNWKKAEKLLARSAMDSESPLMHYLGAANAAQQLFADERRDHYFRLARQEVPKADFVIRLTQAEQQLAHQQSDEALDTLEQLRREKPSHPRLLYLLAQALTSQQQWDKLLKLVPILRKQKAIGEEELSRLEKQSQLQLLTHGGEEDKESLEQQWRDFSRKDRHHPELIHRYASLLNQQGKSALSEELLRKEIRREWSDELVALYGTLATDSVDDQLHTAEKWLRQHPESAALHLALGRLYLRKEVWGQAEQHLDKSLQIEPNSEGYREMAELKRARGDTVAALEYIEREATLLRAERAISSGPPRQQPQMSQNRDDPRLAQLH